MEPLKSILQEIVNCWLGYVLSQPVDIDIAILVCFLANYVGLTYIQNAVDRLRNVQDFGQEESFGLEESMDVAIARTT